MATRQERMRDRMRGAGRHNVGEVDFGFIIPVAEEYPDEPEASPAVAASPVFPPPSAATTTRPTPNTSAKRKHLDRDVSQTSPPLSTARPEIYDIPDHSSTEGTARPQQIRQLPTSLHPPEQSAPSRRMTRREENSINEDEDEPMEDAPPLAPPPSTRQRGPLSSVISATKRLSFDPSPPAQEEVGESPADAPGSGRRRPLRPGAATPVVGSSALLQKVLDDLDDSTQQAAPTSSPIERRVATRRSEVMRKARVSAESAGSGGGTGRARRTSARLSGSSAAESETGKEVSSLMAVEEEEAEGEVEHSTDQQGDVQRASDEAETEEEQEHEREREEADEVGEKEAAQRLGRSNRRRSLPAPSPELSSGLMEESSVPRRRRRREPVSPAQQQQPAKKARTSKPQPKTPAQQPQPQPQVQAQTQAKPKRKPKAQQAKKRKVSNRPEDAEEEDGESTSVPVVVQRFTKPRVSGGQDGEDEPVADVLSGEIPFANRGGVNAVDVLSKLCEELIEAYMTKLEERARTAEDAATKREQKTMYRALEAFQEELRTRLLEHTIALDTLHALRKRVRAAQKEKLALRDEILRIRAERDQVALRMDAIRIRHEAESKEALRHISLSSTMHDIDLAVERGQAAPELSPAEQKKADLANLELLISRVADQACTRSDGGGTLKQLREFNAFLERAAAVLERR
ncbi:hypothetical protein VTK56DRAFT_3359 [Thermocarpiscus australiensis]